MNPAIPLFSVFLLTIAVGAAEPRDTERRLREQERQIERLETENSRLRWLLQRQGLETGADPLYGTTGAGKPDINAPKANFHTVRKGESLSKIAKRVGSTSEELASLNDLHNPQLIKVGQQLRLPDGAQEKYHEPNPEPAKPLPSAPVHIVRAGENLYRIALSHQIDLDELLAANPGIDPRSLRVGQTVRISPSTAQTGSAEQESNSSIFGHADKNGSRDLATAQ